MKKGRFISLVLCFALGFGLGRSSFLDNLSFPSFSWPEFHFSFDFLHGLPFFSSDPSSSVQSSTESIQINTIQVKESNNQEILFPYRSSPYDLSEYGGIYQRDRDFSNITFPQAQKTPSREEVLELASFMDGDFAFILENTEAEYNFMEWWDDKETLVDSFATAIHEQTHQLTSQYETKSAQSIPYEQMARVEINGETVRYNHGMAVYLGEGYLLQVDITDVFDSIHMAQTIPQELRSVRYNTYLGDNYQVGSRLEGIYGLLNEYVAYYWGAKAELDLLKLYHDEITYPQFGMIRQTNDVFLPYAEFTYWILTYLDFSKEYDPAVYEGIINNDAFKQAFTFIYQNYGALAQELLTYTDTIVSSSKEDYDRLMKEINTSSSLQTCLKELTS